MVTSFSFVLWQSDKCIPKLLEGDQIVLINGRDISEHTHDQVVMFIKASRESHTRELVLLIRRKGKYLCDVLLLKSGVVVGSCCLEHN